MSVHLRARTHAHTHVYHNLPIKVRGWLGGAGSLLLSHGTWWTNSSCQIWQTALLPTEIPHWSPTFSILQICSNLGLLISTFFPDAINGASTVAPCFRSCIAEVADVTQMRYLTKKWGPTTRVRIFTMYKTETRSLKFKAFLQQECRNVYLFEVLIQSYNISNNLLTLNNKYLKREIGLKV